MKRIAALMMFFSVVCHGQATLSEHSEISVITLGPWQGEVFTAFGHSAIRVNDPLNRIDFAFNYGVFDFNRPNFYLNFARGNNVYMLGVYDYKGFEYQYISDNRYVHEQVLNLTHNQKQRLYNFLEWNARPENREYLYDYFYDNCATKVPEVILKVLGDSVVFDGSYIKTDYSIRDLTDIYLREQPWGDLGIDIGLGLPTDKKATPYEYMFLPDYVESGFAHATILVNGEKQPLVKSRRVIYESVPEENAAGFFRPVIVFSLFLLLTIIVSFRDLKKKKLSIYFDRILFSVLGVLGICLLLLWVATNHHAASKNFNLLWALPTHLIPVIVLRSKAKWLKTYFLIVAVETAVLLICWPVIPQNLHDSLIPLVIAAGVRSGVQFRIRESEL